jgi:predicted nucleic acid-binding protein
LAVSRAILGNQLADVDLLIAAVATRLGDIIVSSDTDFDALPVKRENWRV